MSKKVTALIIALCVIVIAISAVLLVVTIGGTTAETPAESESENINQEPNDDQTVGGGFKLHVSENGYTVKYPEKYTSMKMGKAVDFILTDELSGSSINIITAKNDGSLKKMNEYEFQASLNESQMGVTVKDYKEFSLNGADAVRASYNYNGNEVTQTVIILPEYGYNITFTQSPSISQEVLDEFLQVINSFKLVD